MKYLPLSLAVTLVLAGCGSKSIPRPSDTAIERAIRAFNRDTLMGADDYRRIGGDLDSGYELADSGGRRVKMQIGDSYDFRFTKQIGGYIADYPSEVYSAMFTGDNPGGRGSDQFSGEGDRNLGPLCINFNEGHVIGSHRCHLSSP